MRIAIDAMGGDNAPSCVIEGTLATARALPGHRYLLVGPRERIEEELRKHGGAPPCVTVEHASDVIRMDEHPDALRIKRDSSIMRCVKLVLEGKADGLLSAGNTGAVVGASYFKLGLIESVKRPGILVPLPSEKGAVGLIDVGANIYTQPFHLLQYAIMGSVYVQASQLVGEEPSVGLLNIGEESEKGTKDLQHAYQLFKKFFGPRFVGNIEGHELFSGKARVVACDGFVGNVVLKMAEGLAEMVLVKCLQNGLPVEARSHVEKFRARFDYAEQGGAPLLGVNGVVTIAHGRSSGRAISRAIETTIRLAEQSLVPRIAQALRSLSLWKRVQLWWQKEA